MTRPWPGGWPPTTSRSPPPPPRRPRYRWLLIGLLPLLLIGGLFVSRPSAAPAGRLRGWEGSAGAGGLTKAKARIIDAERPVTRFADVAGYPTVKTDIGEVVDYLRHPGRYRLAGARGPRGVLMAGPPGTGKTLLARAVAGEAGVPFLSISGSSFVEMFVGVGAARVRDLFEQARTRAPAIVFIDEIDALGARRDVGALPGSDEREQTLNQLLAEMDGFEPSGGVVVLAATNRPDALDPALRRPGRFDREVMVPLPSRAEREAILASHARGKHVDACRGLRAGRRRHPRILRRRPGQPGQRGGADRGPGRPYHTHRR